MWILGFCSDMCFGCQREPSFAQHPEAFGQEGWGLIGPMTLRNGFHLKPIPLGNFCSIMIIPTLPSSLLHVAFLPVSAAAATAAVDGQHGCLFQPCCYYCFTHSRYFCIGVDDLQWGARRWQVKSLSTFFAPHSQNCCSLPHTRATALLPHFWGGTKRTVGSAISQVTYFPPI